MGAHYPLYLGSVLSGDPDRLPLCGLETQLADDVEAVKRETVLLRDIAPHESFIMVWLAVRERLLDSRDSGHFQLANLDPHLLGRMAWHSARISGKWTASHT